MELKKYEFALDNSGQDQQMRLATDADVAKALDQGRGDGEETSPSEVLHNLTMQEMDKHPSLNYRTALQRVQSKNKTLVRLHASESGGRIRVEARP